MTEELAEYSNPEFNENDISVTPPDDIIAYNELRSCAELARLSQHGKINLHSSFQRDIVWKVADQTRFIDSLVKQLPIPSMCFAFDSISETWVVVDGLQRMTSIVKFLNGGDWRLSQLDDIDKRLSGKDVALFKTGRGNQKKIFQRVQNKILPITVLHCRFSEQNHMEYLFTVFHRLNAGGLKLNNQEIRNCIFSGPFNNLLQELDELPNWRRFNRMENGKSYRFVKQEVILRIFAFAERLNTYTGNVGKFLNDCMRQWREMPRHEIAERRILFQRTSAVVGRLFPNEPDERYPTSFVEAFFVGVMKNIDTVERLDDQDLRNRFSELRNTNPFSEEGLAEGLSKKEKVSERVDAALRIFA